MKVPPLAIKAPRVVRPWLIAWLGGSILGILNGTIRELAYKDQFGEEAANYISTATLIVLLTVYMWLLERRWPIPTRYIAFRIGAYWVALTIAFEFGFGHYVDGKSWTDLLNNYNLADGQAWLLVLVWMLVAPAVVSGATVRSRRYA